MKKISFLIAAHNEEKIISNALDNLLNLPYGNYEVIIGLDGCTDGTLKIVQDYCKKSKRFRVFNLDIRKGKPAVINEIIKKASGEIIIINDADWTFEVKNKAQLEKFISVFDDSEVGGIAESWPIEDMRRTDTNIGYKMVALSSHYWFLFQKKRFTLKKGRFLFLDSSALFMTNIFRKNLYKPNSTLGDDFERTRDILSTGKKIVTFNEEDIPRMRASYSQISISDLFRQKIRTANARKQIKSGKREVGLKYYLEANAFIIRKAFSDGITSGLMVALWFLITSSATAVAALKNLDTERGWQLRHKRH